MENEEKPSEGEKEIIETANDKEFVDFLIGHIDEPCGVAVGPDRYETILKFYLNLAKESLAGVTQDGKKITKIMDLEQRNILVTKIREHEPAYMPKE